MLRHLLFFCVVLALALPAAGCDDTEPACREFDHTHLERTLTALTSRKAIRNPAQQSGKEKCVRAAMAKALNEGMDLSDSMMAVMTKATYAKGWTEFEPRVEEFLQAPRASSRVATMHALAKSAPKVLEGRLGELLHSEHGDVRSAAAAQAALAGARKHIALLTTLFLKSEGPEKKIHRQALIDLRAGTELADFVAKNPAVVADLIEVMTEASDDLQPVLSLLSHNDATLRLAVIPWIGRDATQSEATDAAVLAALALAVSDGDAAVREAAQKQIWQFSQSERRQPMLLSLFEAELAKPESKPLAGLCYGIDYSEAGEARLRDLSKSKDNALKACGKQALKAIKDKKRAEKSSKP